jgi:hypothetical protein
MNQRREILSLLKELPKAMTAEPEELLNFIESRHLMGLGLGYVDVHLLAAALLTAVPLWTDDMSLKEAATRLQVAYKVA